MRQLAVVVVLAVGVYVAIDAMADLTQSRPETVDAGFSTGITFDVATRRAASSEQAAVDALWGVCAQTIPDVDVDGPTRVANGYRVVLRPALGEHRQRRLTGCLEDAIVDRVLGEVVEVETLPASSGRQDSAEP